MTLGLLKQLPVFSIEHYSKDDLRFISSRVLELTYTSTSMESWASDLGYQGMPFQFNPDRRAQLRAELDAYYARLYGLTRDELRYILDPSDIIGDDYPSETFRVLQKNECANSANTAPNAWCWRHGMPCKRESRDEYGSKYPAHQYLRR